MLCWLRVVVVLLPSASTEHVALEHVVAHGREGLVRGTRQARRFRGLFQECLDPVAVRRGPHDEVRRRRTRDRDRRHRDPGAPGQMGLDHLRRVDPVHVIGSEHRNQVGPVAVDAGQRLVGESHPPSRSASAGRAAAGRAPGTT